MNKRLFFVFLFAFLLLAFAPLASAATAPDPADTVAYWALEDLTDLTGNGNTLTNNGATSGVTGIIDNAYSFDGTNDYLYTSNIAFPDSVSVSGWYNADILPSVGGNSYILSKYSQGTSSKREFVLLASVDDKFVFQTIDSGGTTHKVFSTSSVSTSTWYHVVGTYNHATNELKIYVDGVLENTKSSASKRDSVQNIEIGGRAFNSFADGRLDEISLYDYELPSEQVTYLYASGSPGSSQQYPFVGAGNITITVTDEWDGSAVNNINVTIDGTTYQNATGNIVYTDIASNASVTNDITIDASDYFSRTFTADTMETKTLSVYQSDITMQARSIVSNSTVTANFTIDGNQQSNYKLKAGSYTATVEPTGDYFDLSHDFNVTPLDNRTEYAYVYNSNVNLSVINARTGGLINGTKTGWYYNAANNYNRTFNFSGDNTTLELEQGLSYEFNLDPVSGYATNTGLQFTFTPDNTTENQNFQLYENNSIQFTFRDGSDNSLITNQVNATLSNANQTYQFNTTSGQFFLDEVQGGTYTLTSNTQGFSESSILITVVNNEFQTVNIVFGSGFQNKQFNVIDNLDDPVAGVVITFTRDINGSTVTIAQKTTDFSGAIQVLLDEDVEYDFTAVKSGYNTFSGSVTPFQNIYIINIEAVGSRRYVSLFDDVQYSIGTSYANATNSAYSFFSVLSNNGYIQYWGMNTSYDGTSYSINNSGSPSGGTVDFNIMGINLSVQDTVKINYWIKSTNYSLVEFSETYKLGDGGTQNIATWDFSNLPNGAKAFVSMFILLLLVGGGLIITRRMFAGAILGVIGVAFCYAVGLLPLGFSLLAGVALVVMIIGDVQSGENR